MPLFAAEAWGLSGLIPYLGAVALADVAARSDRTRVIALTAICWSIALVLGQWLDRYTTMWNAVTAATIVAAVGVPLLLGLYLRGQRQLAALYRERAADAELRRATAESAVRSQERTAMARELHDLVAHHMASIVLRVGVAEHVLDGADPRMAAVLDDVHATAVDALADIRRLQDALRNPVGGEVAMIDPDGLWTEIDAAVRRTRAAGFTVSDHIDRQVRLDAVARLTLLRVTQEALTNAMKHGVLATPVDLTIGRHGGGVAVCVRSGYDAEVAPNCEGHGIIGMTERVNLLGGRLEIRRDKRDWVIEAWLPETVTSGEDLP